MSDSSPPILIVEDDDAYRSYLLDALTREGVAAIVAPSARAALSIIAERKIGGLIIDVLMPEMDGIELVRALRKRGTTLPVLVLSADVVAGEIYLKAAAAMGATFVGPKGPGDRDLLCALIKSVETVATARSFQRPAAE